MSEAETVLQPSLHTIPEYAGMVLDEVESRGIDVSDLRAELDADNDLEWIGDLIDDALGRLSDAGYANIEQDDTLLIMPQGEELPSEWQD